MSGVPSYSFHISLITPYIIFFSGKDTYSMKKAKNTFRILPDSAKPEQNTIQNILSLMIFFFFHRLCLRLCGEVLIFLFCKRRNVSKPWFSLRLWRLFTGLAQFYFRLYYPLMNYCQILQENIRKTTLSLSFSSLPFLGSGLELVIGWFLDLF